MFTFSFDAVDAIRRHVEAADQEEAGGLLAIREGVIGWALEAVNCAPERTREFGISSSQLAELIDALEARGFRLAGSYHSHPNGDPQMSHADAAMAGVTGALLIVAPGRRWQWSLWNPVAGGKVDFAIAPPWSV